MSQPQSIPVEEARKKFADILDGTQFRSTHTQITRRGKAAGYVVPPEWYASITVEVEALRRKVEELSAPPAQPSPPQEPRPAAEPRRAPAPKRKPEPTVEGRPLLEDEAQKFAALARSRATALQNQGLDQATGPVGDGIKDYVVVSEALSMGLLTHDEVYGPAGSEETTT